MDGDFGSATEKAVCQFQADHGLAVDGVAGLRRQHELWDGTYTLDDQPDSAELIRVRRENDARAIETRA